MMVFATDSSLWRLPKPCEGEEGWPMGAWLAMAWHLGEGDDEEEEVMD